MIPAPIFNALLSLYHRAIAQLAAIIYEHPSRGLIVIGVTGTKGKTSVTEMLNAIFEHAGWKTALVNSIRFKIGETSDRNLTRMTMPGRFFLQHFLSRAVQATCRVAILEMTSEGARQHRHRGIDLDMLIFTNLAPEHIESHGSLRAYADAKFQLGLYLARSRKRPRFMVANADDKEASRYLLLPVERILPFSLSEHTPFEASEGGGSFLFEGQTMLVRLPGEFSLKNALAAATAARAFNISIPTIAEALNHLTSIPGRGERVDEGQPFTAVVDYAHTPDSLAAIYSAYRKARKICVLGATGGGRDSWKRPVMGRIADEQCSHVILTNEDPYDEDPELIIADIAHGMSRKPEIVVDRRAAIRRALELARPGDAVIITGKGTDPSIAGPRGTKIPWSDVGVVREEIRALQAQVQRARVSTSGSQEASV